MSRDRPFWPAHTKYGRAEEAAKNLMQNPRCFILSPQPCTPSHNSPASCLKQELENHATPRTLTTLVAGISAAGIFMRHAIPRYEDELAVLQRNTRQMLPEHVYFVGHIAPRELEALPRTCMSYILYMWHPAPLPPKPAGKTNYKGVR